MKGFGLLADGTTFDLSASDLSYEGCKIETDIALFPGVKFKLSMLGFRGVIDAQVCWRRDGQAGVKFMSESAPQKPHTPRADEREELTSAVSLRRLGRKQYQAQIFDLTARGCKVEFIERPRAGELLWIKFDGLDSIEAIVRWVDGFYGGLQFVRPIHESIFDRLIARLKAPTGAALN